jgi:protein SCO1/2
MKFIYIWRWVVLPAFALLITMSLMRNFIYPNFIESEEREVAIGGNFVLMNQHSETVRASDFNEKLMLVYFGFTHCPGMCPSDLAVMTEALYSLGGDASEVVPIFITVDPERDNVERMAEYASNFHPSLQALTGIKEDIDRVVKAYKVFYQRAEDDVVDGYDINHSGYMYLMGRTGKYLTHFRHGQPVEEIIAGIKKYL